MLIRKARVYDLKEIDKIYLEGVIDELQLQFPDKSKFQIIKEMNKACKDRLKGFEKEIISSTKNLWLVAEIEGNIVGFANAEIKNKKEGALTMLYIKRPLRRQGIGKELTVKRIDWLKKKDVKEISAGVLIKNKASLNNLRKLGFKETSIKLVKKV